MEFTTAMECYEVRHLDGQGNGLFATRDIEKGELIFREFPFVWNGFKVASNVQSSFCYSCGEFIAKSTANVKCDGGCQVMYCSAKCSFASNAKGHKFICSCYRRGGLVDQLSTTNKTGHLALALQCYMRIAQTCVDLAVDHNKLVASSPALVDHVERSAQIILSGYHKDDFCRANHAVRTNRLAIPDMEMFESMIAPAYFAGSLQDGLDSIYHAFAALPLSMWTHEHSATENGDPANHDSEAQASQLREAFLFGGEGGIFHPVYFRFLMGTFMVNNHHVHLQESVSAGAGAGAGSGAGARLLGTALYPTVSKMNHSCECNTTNSHSKTDVQLAVFATAAIAQGQELTTSYLHRRGAHARPQSRASRHKAMLQYLFTCTCPKCERERIAAQQIRRAHRGDVSTTSDGLIGASEDSEFDTEDESSSDEEEEHEPDGADQCY